VDNPGSGAIHILFGGPGGLTTDGSRRIARANQDDTGFGSILAIGDLNRDLNRDVFEANPGRPRWVDDPPTPGHLTVSLGDAGGPSVSQWIRGQYAGGPTSLAVGDVTGDGFDDVVAGIPVNAYVGEDEDETPGVVALWRGSRVGPARKPILISQSTRGVPGNSEEFDQFGESVVVTRVDGDRFADIIVGAPGEDEFRGRVTVIRGAAKGAARRGHQVLDRAAGKRVTGRAFGYELALLDNNGDGRLDLSILDNTREGAVTVLRGVKGGFRQRRPARRWLDRLGLKRRDTNPTLGRAGSS
jgi:hypothetical protein